MNGLTNLFPKYYGNLTLIKEHIGVIQATLFKPDMCNPDFFSTGQIGRSRCVPIHIIPIRIIWILPNPGLSRDACIADKII